MLETYEKLMARIAERIVNRSMSEFEFERSTVARCVKIGRYLKVRFARSTKRSNPESVRVFVKSVQMMQF